MASVGELFTAEEAEALRWLARGLISARKRESAPSGPTPSKATSAKKTSAPKATGPVADDADLDGEWGDPEVRKDPPRWAGPPMVGRKYSQTSAEYLDSLAGFLAWKAGKDDEKGDEQSAKYAGYARKDAARARGWAARMRSPGWALRATAQPPAEDTSPPVEEEFAGDDDIPF
jgi:hypothetical protein